MVREHGRKRLYFDDCTTCARFVNMYKDLFIDGWFKVIELVTSRGIVYELIFIMKHSDMDSIRKNINTIKRSFAIKEGRAPYRTVREFVEA